MGRAWAYGCKIEEHDLPNPTAQQRAPSCRGNRHRSLPPRSSCQALCVPTSCTRSRSCNGVSAFVNQRGGPSIAKACRVIRSAGGSSSSGRTSLSSPGSRASLVERPAEPPARKGFLNVPKLARSCPYLPTLAEVSRSRGTVRRVWGRRWAGLSAPWPRLSPSKPLRRRYGNLRCRSVGAGMTMSDRPLH